MLCERCGENQASIHLTRIIDGKKEEIHLCKECAGKSSQLNSDENSLNFQSLLSGILDHNFSNQKSKIINKNKSEELICDYCGLSYQDFIKQGFFGCENCFEVFENRLDSLFKRIHGNIRHTGKYPVSFHKKIKAESEVSELKKAMQTAIEKENFEKAAEIRDKIHAIEDDMEEDIDE